MGGFGGTIPDWNGHNHGERTPCVKVCPGFNDAHSDADEAIIFADIRRHPDGQVRVYDKDGRLICGQTCRQVVPPVDQRSVDYGRGFAAGVHLEAATSDRLAEWSDELERERDAARRVLDNARGVGARGYRGGAEERLRAVLAALAVSEIPNAPTPQDDPQWLYGDVVRCENHNEGVRERIYIFDGSDFRSPGGQFRSLAECELTLIVREGEAVT